MSVDKIPAGRELDKLIAQEVFGWTRLDEFPNEQVKSHGWGAPSANAVLHIIPYYSTNIVTAFRLLEKVAHWDLDFDEDRESGRQYVCEVGFHIDKVKGRGGGLCVIRGAWAETAPLAICRAVLKVFAEKEEACRQAAN